MDVGKRGGVPAARHHEKSGNSRKLSGPSVFGLKHEITWRCCWKDWLAGNWIEGQMPTTPPNWPLLMAETLDFMCAEFWPKMSWCAGPLMKEAAKAKHFKVGAVIWHAAFSFCWSLLIFLQFDRLVESGVWAVSGSHPRWDFVSVVAGWNTGPLRPEEVRADSESCFGCSSVQR